MRSAEFQDALAGTGIDSWELRRQLWEAAPDLVLTAPDFLQFTQTLHLVDTWGEIREQVRRLDLAPLRWRGWAVLAVGPLALLVTAAVLIAGVLGWAGAFVLVCLLATAGIVVFASYSAIYVAADLAEESRGTLTREVVGPYLRKIVSERVNTPERERRLYVTSAPGLGGLSDRDQVVSTRAAERLTRVVAGMTAGSVAVCGRRGVGKTTLLRSLCDAGLARAEEPELRVLVSAPVDYDVREFVLHLFARLCTAVAGDPPRREPAAMAIPDGLGLAHRVGRYLRRILTGLAAIACAAAGADLLIGLPSPDAVPRWAGHFWAFMHDLRALADPRAWSAARIPVGIVLLLLAVVLAYRTMHRRSRRPVVRIEDDLPGEARRQLDRIRFLQTFTTGYSGGVKIPAGVQVGATIGRQLAEQQLTLPALVDAYRAFAEQTAAWWRARHADRGRLVIGIDEVDRIRDADSAERFLNDLKAVFGSPHCVYLVSVSEEALARFQLRIPSGRTVFDSAFDEIVGVTQLHYTEVRELLMRRVAGISDPYIALCHALSGGLPRDVLRTARALIAGVTATGEAADLANQATRLISEEVAALKYATIRALTTDIPAAIPDGAPTDYAELLRHLVNETWPGDTPEALAHASGQVRACTAGPVADSLAVTLDYLAAVADHFGPSLDQLITDIRSGNMTVEALAQARAALSIDAKLAEELVARARE